METKKKTVIKVETKVQAPVEKVWNLWTAPEHIMNWNSASEDWHTTYAENDLRPGGKFLSRMQSRDGSVGFDFFGVYNDVRTCKLITSTLGDGREVITIFSGAGNETTVTETFEAEDTNPVDMQRNGWQAIMDNFKKYVESS